MAEVIKTNIDVAINTSKASAELKKLQTQINAFNLTLNRGSVDQLDASKRWASGLADVVNNTKFFRAETVRLQTSAGALDSVLKRGSATMGQFFSAAFNKRGTMFAETTALASERVRTLQTQFIATSKASGGMQEALAIRPLAAFSSQASIAAQRMTILSAMFKQGTTNLINFGKNVQWAGRQLMVGFTVPLTIFGTAATKVFRDLEKEVVNFKKVYGDLFTTDLEVETNLNAVKELSKEFTKYGIAAKETMMLAAIGAQAGKEGAELQAATIQATRLSVLGDIDRQEAMKTTIALQSAFKLSNEELANSINFLNLVENSSVVSLQNLTDAIPRVAPVIVGLGGDIKDMAVFLAAMQEGGVNAAEAANGLKSSLGRLISPTKQAKEMADEFGISLENIVKVNEGNVLGMVISLSESMKQLTDLQKQQLLSAVFGKFQFARMGALFENITREGSQASRIIEMMDTSIEDLAATADKELGAIEDSIGTQLTASIERFKLAIAPIGELFAKIAIPLLNFATKILEAFNSISDSRKTMLALAAVVVGVVVPAFTMFFGLIMNLLGNLSKFGQLIFGFFTNFARKGPIAAIRSLTQSSKYLSLAEIDAANAARQLGSATEITNAALLKQVGAGTSATAAINALTASYRLLAAEQARAVATQPALFATGSAIVGRRLPIVKRNKGGEIFTLNDGNRVPGVGNTDTVPAMLTPGEFVVNKESTENNLDILRAINSGTPMNLGGQVKGGILHAMAGAVARSFGAKRVSNFISAETGAFAAKGRPTTRRGQSVRTASSQNIPPGQVIGKKDNFVYGFQPLTNQQLKGNAIYKEAGFDRMGVPAEQIKKEMLSSEGMFFIDSYAGGPWNRKGYEKAISNKIDQIIANNPGKEIRFLDKKGLGRVLNNPGLKKDPRYKDIKFLSVADIHDKNVLSYLEPNHIQRLKKIETQTQMLARGRSREFTAGTPMFESIDMLPSTYPAGTTVRVGDQFTRADLYHYNGEKWNRLRKIEARPTDMSIGPDSYHRWSKGIKNWRGEKRPEGIHASHVFNTGGMVPIQKFNPGGGPIRAARALYSTAGGFGSGKARIRLNEEFFRISEMFLGKRGRGVNLRAPMSVANKDGLMLEGLPIVRGHQGSRIDLGNGEFFHPALMFFQGKSINSLLNSKRGVRGEELLKDFLEIEKRGLYPPSLMLAGLKGRGVPLDQAVLTKVDEAYRAIKSKLNTDKNKMFTDTIYTEEMGKILEEILGNNLKKPLTSIGTIRTSIGGSIGTGIRADDGTVSRLRGSIPGFNDGNIVPGVGNTDTVPAMLTPGEFVINKESTRQNYDLLTAINNGMNVGGKVKAYRDGGMAKGVQFLNPGGLVLGYDASGRAIVSASEARALANSGQMFSDRNGKQILTPKGLENRISRGGVAAQSQKRTSTAARGATTAKIGAASAAAGGQFFGKGAMGVGMAAGLLASFPVFGMQEQLGPIGSMVAGLAAWTAASKVAQIAWAKLTKQTITTSKVFPQLTGAMNGLVGILGRLGIIVSTGALAAFMGISAIVIGLGVGITKMRDNIVNSGAKLSNAMFGSAKSLEGMAKAFERVTPGRQILQQQAERAAGRVISEEAKGESAKFMESSAGKQLLKDLAFVQKMGKDQAVALKNQLAQAVIAGIITTEEAQQIAIDVGAALNDTNLAVKVTGQLDRLLGLDGKNIKDNRLDILAQISASMDERVIAQQIEQQMKIIQNAKINPFKVGFDFELAIQNISSKIFGKESISAAMQLRTLTNNILENTIKEREVRSQITLEYQKGALTFAEYKNQINQLDANQVGADAVAQFFEQSGLAGVGIRSNVSGGADYRGREPGEFLAGRFSKGITARKIKSILPGGEETAASQRGVDFSGISDSTIKEGIDLINELNDSFNEMLEEMNLTKTQKANIQKFLTEDYENSAEELAKLQADILSGRISFNAIMDAQRIEEEDPGRAERIRSATGGSLIEATQKVSVIQDEDLRDEILKIGEGFGKGSRRGGGIQVMDEFIKKYEMILGLPPEIVRSLKIDMGDKESIEKFALRSETLIRQWNILDALNPSQDKEVIFRLISLDENGLPLEDEKYIEKIKTINQALFDLESSDPSVVKQAEISLFATYNNKSLDEAEEEINKLRETYKDWESFDPGEKALVFRYTAEIDEIGLQMQALENLIKNNPTSIKQERWLEQLQQLSKDREALRGKITSIETQVATRPTEPKETGGTKELSNLEKFRESFKETMKTAKDFYKVLASGKGAFDTENASLLIANGLLDVNAKQRKKVINEIKRMNSVQAALAFLQKSMEERAIEELEKRKNAIQKEINVLNDAVSEKQRQNELDQRQISIRSRGLELISRQEQKIGEIYDERINALSKVERANDRIARQQQSQTSLASAIASGDFGAAASAASQMQSEFAQSQMEDTRTALEARKQTELSNITTLINGQKFTRAQIEQQIQDIGDRIYERELSTIPILDAIYDKNQLIKIENEKIELIKDRLAIKEEQEIARGLKIIGNLDKKVQGEKKITRQKKLQAFLNQVAPGKSNNYNTWLKSVGLATGGHIRGAGTSKSDSIPAMLSNGEYVINAKTVKSLGTEFFDAINSGNIPGFKTGGRAPNKVPKSSPISTRAMMNQADKGPTKKQETGQKLIKGVETLSKVIAAVNPLTMGKNNPLGKGLANMGGAGELLGLNSVIRLSTDQGVKGDKLHAGMFPLNFVGFGAPSLIKTTGTQTIKSVTSANASKGASNPISSVKNIATSVKDYFLNPIKNIKDVRKAEELYTGKPSSFFEFKPKDAQVSFKAPKPSIINPFKSIPDGLAPPLYSSGSMAKNALNNTTSLLSQVLNFIPKKINQFKVALADKGIIPMNSTMRSYILAKQILGDLGMFPKEDLLTLILRTPKRGQGYSASAAGKTVTEQMKLGFRRGMPTGLLTSIHEMGHVALNKAARSDKLTEVFNAPTQSKIRRVNTINFFKKLENVGIPISSKTRDVINPIHESYATFYTNLALKKLKDAKSPLADKILKKQPEKFPGIDTYNSSSADVLGEATRQRLVDLKTSVAPTQIMEEYFKRFKDLVGSRNYQHNLEWMKAYRVTNSQLSKIFNKSKNPADDAREKMLLNFYKYFGIKTPNDAYQKLEKFDFGDFVKYIDSQSDNLIKLESIRYFKNIRKFALGGSVKKYGMGGMIGFRGSREAPPPVKMAFGSVAPGLGNTDSVPALLTPGEFVVRKSVAAENMGLLKALNGDVFPQVGRSIDTDSIPSITSISAVGGTNLYNNNYSVNVNVSGTDESASDIANIVVRKLKTMNDRNIRGSRF